MQLTDSVPQFSCSELVLHSDYDTYRVDRDATTLVPTTVGLKARCVADKARVSLIRSYPSADPVRLPHSPAHHRVSNLDPDPGPERGAHVRTEQQPDGQPEPAADHGTHQHSFLDADRSAKRLPDGAPNHGMCMPDAWLRGARRR